MKDWPIVPQKRHLRMFREIQEMMKCPYDNEKERPCVISEVVSCKQCPKKEGE